jgi:hypothetical protein
MVHRSTCSAQCKSGAVANGSFMCLAGKVRLDSVCAGQPGNGAVTLGDKVLFTLGVMSSECPSQEQLRTILASALDVGRDTLKGVFCEAGEQVPLSQDDARLAGRPSALALTIGGEVHLEIGKAIPAAQDLLERVAQLPDRRTAVGTRFATAMWDAVHYIGSVEQLHTPLLVPDQVTDFSSKVHEQSVPVPPPIGHKAESTGLASGYLAAIMVAAPLGFGMMCVGGVAAVRRCRETGSKKDEGEWAEV